MKIYAEYLKSLKNTIFPESSDNTSVIADYYIRIMLFLYPMYLAQDQIWGLFTDKEIIYFILSLLSIILSFVLLRKRKVNQFRMKFIDIYLILLAIVMVMMITVRLIRKDMDIESEILLLCFFRTLPFIYFKYIPKKMIFQASFKCCCFYLFLYNL